MSVCLTPATDQPKDVSMVRDLSPRIWKKLLSSGLGFLPGAGETRTDASRWNEHLQRRGEKEKYARGGGRRMPRVRRFFSAR